MMRSSVFARRYVQGAGALAHLGSELKRLGKGGNKVFALIDDMVVGQVQPSLDALTEFSVTRHPFSGHCTRSTIARIVAIAQEKDATTLVAFGGGSVLDVGRAAAFEAGLAFVSAPTIAASDAPCSGIAAMYDEKGEITGYMKVRNPDLVIVDTALIARAPVRFFVAGIGDGLATWYEAESCRKSHAATISGWTGTALAHAAARLCRDTLFAQGRQAVRDCQAHLASPDLEAVIEATVLLSEIGFESGGLGAAHGISNGLTMLPQTAAYLHGEKVTIGLLSSLFLSEWPEKDRRNIFQFCRDVGLPVCLHQIDCNASDDNALAIVAAKTCQAGGNIHHEPFPVTPEMVVMAMKLADQFGTQYLNT
jgi:glycerol dehydrogenase